MRASQYDNIDVVKYLVEHKADVNTKRNVITALPDSCFVRMIVLMFCDAAVGSAEWLHRAN